jgi:muconate/chloromuconate cycloisomerase
LDHIPPVDAKTQIASVETTLIDIPFRRLQRFSRFETRTQTTLLVRVRDKQGREGHGEAVVPGGPWWSGDSIEAVQTLIDHHLAPVIAGLRSGDTNAILTAMQRTAPGAHVAQAGLEMACLDLLARTIGVPVAMLLGGFVRDRIPVVWPLASGTLETDLEEIETKLASGEASGFKIKLGALPLAEDLRRLTRLVEAIDRRGTIVVDPNEAWDEAVAQKAFPHLNALRIDLIEQPVSRNQPESLAALTRASNVPVMVDEGACSPEQVFRLAHQRAARVLSLKLMKAGGVIQSRKMAEIARAAGMSLYMGTFLETSLGTAAGLHLAASLPSLEFGGELFGPQLMAADTTTAAIVYRDGHSVVPSGPGWGVSVDPDQVRDHRRR